MPEPADSSPIWPVRKYQKTSIILVYAPTITTISTLTPKLQRPHTQPQIPLSQLPRSTQLHIEQIRPIELMYSVREAQKYTEPSSPPPPHHPNSRFRTGRPEVTRSYYTWLYITLVTWTMWVEDRARFSYQKTTS